MLIVIPATSGHKPVVEISLTRLRQRFPCASYLVVSPTPNLFSDFMDSEVIVAADDEFSPVTKSELETFLSPDKRHMVSWYYQQFLKYSVVAKSHEERVLILDADTVLIRDIESSPDSFFTSKEQHEMYFEHFRHLFGATAPFRASAITNFMWFNPDDLRDMLYEISQRNSNTAWWKVIINIANDISDDAAFSEYETYANWYSLHYGHHTEVPINIFRRGDLLVRSNVDYTRVVDAVEAKGYDAVAFELNHRSGLLRKLGAWLVLKFAVKLW